MNRTTIHLSILLVGLLPLGVAAQERMITGRVLAADQPVANQLVSLHRVTSAGGSTISVDTTSADGRFQLRIESLPRDAIHFVATRWEGKLFVGETFRQPPTGEYRLAVGPGATPIELGDDVRPPTVAAPADRSGQSAGLIVIVVAALVLGSIVWWTARPRPSPALRLLLEIADLDNRHAQAALTNYEVQRADLLRRLRESA